MDEVRARMWESGGRWFAKILDSPMYVEVTGVSRRECLAELRAAAGEGVSITVEVIPQIAGVAEAAEIMEWDKRRVITYLDRGSFPEPTLALASGRVGLREDIETYAREWRSRHPPKTGKAT